MKKLIMALAVVLALPLRASDYHVLEDTDGDGFANPCSNTNHQATYSTDTLACGGSVDIDGDGTSETIYCTVQPALNAATSPGDSVEVHNGTWDEDQDNNGVNETPHQPADRYSDDCDVSGLPGKAMHKILACSTCDTESERRYFRAAWIDSNTNGRIDSGEQDTSVVITASKTGLILHPFLLCEEGNTSSRIRTLCDYVTIDGFEISGFDARGIFGAKDCGLIYAAGRSNYWHVSNLYVHDLGESTDSPDSSPGVVANATGIVDGGVNTGWVIANNRMVLSKQSAFKFHSENCPTDSTGECTSTTDSENCQNFTNMIVYRNDITVDDPSPTRGHWFGHLKGVRNIVLYGNRWTVASGDPWVNFYNRSNQQNVVYFNNYLHGVGRVNYIQGTCGTIKLFNNTLADATAYYRQLMRDDSPGNGDPNLNLKFWSKNNIWTGSNSEIIYNFNSAFGDGSNPSRIYLGYELFTKTNNDLFYEGSVGGSAGLLDRGHYVCPDSTTCGSNVAYTECNTGSGGCNPTSSLFVGSGEKPTPYYRLSATSTALGKGTNDPDEDGVTGFKIDWENDGIADIDCSPPNGWPGPGITASPTLHMTCDYDGDERGSTWDIGADEYGAAVCGNGNIEAGEDCDGSQHGGATCISLGFAGGTLSCDGSCNFVTTNCTPVASTSNLSLSGVTIRGGSIK